VKLLTDKQKDGQTPVKTISLAEVIS